MKTGRARDWASVCHCCCRTDFWASFSSDIKDCSLSIRPRLWEFTLNSPDQFFVVTFSQTNENRCLLKTVAEIGCRNWFNSSLEGYLEPTCRLRWRTPLTEVRGRGTGTVRFREAGRWQWIRLSGLTTKLSVPWARALSKIYLWCPRPSHTLKHSPCLQFPSCLSGLSSNVSS